MSEALSRKSEQFVDDTDDFEVDGLDAVTSERNIVRQYLNEIDRIALLTAEEEVELSMRIEAGLYAGYLLENPDENTIGARAEELEWMREDGVLAKKQMIEANLRLVVSLARRRNFQNHLRLLDLIQEGNLGLIRAVEKFDYKKSFKFSVYGTWGIHQEIIRAIAKNDRTVHLSLDTVEDINKVKRVIRSFQSEPGKQPTNDEIAAEVGMSAEKVQELLDFDRAVLSLNMKVGEDETAELVDILIDTAPELYDEVEKSITNKQQVLALMEKLSPREQMVVALRYGLNDGWERGFKEISDKLRISRRQVSNIHKNALEALRNDPASRTLDYS